MSDDQQWTIKRLLDWTTDFFEKAGSDSPRLESEILLAEALDCQRIQLYARFNDVPVEPNLGRFRRWVKRRAAGEPVAYLVGYREFFSLRFKVNQHVLIPRPETEHVVLAVQECASRFSTRELRIADVGTGSGCIAITLAVQLPDSRVWATDISPEALTIALTNAEAHRVAERIEFVHCDVMEGVADTGDFHLIVSNPPYVGTDEVGTLDDSVREYEPTVALFSGRDGTMVTERLVTQSAKRLSPGGFLVFETSPIVADRCLNIVRSEKAFVEPRVVKDLCGHQRVVVAQKQQ